ncbi:hypothetical protein DAKH74_028830 [Maudiozyma humilis]|uniref:Uncharacterized protein n=1 Tax=Maudiozyma humilis TaxID=51915 RepID=A0AAV5RY37_MAUHU|nr:hypothetical protein DAKH74_028830 [Kazachstania humilis]
MRLIDLLISSVAVTSMVAGVELDATLKAEVEALVKDIKDNEYEYYSIALKNPDVFYFDGLPGVAMNTDDNGYFTGSESYLQHDLDLKHFDYIVHKMPWYSTRLQPLVESFLSGGDTSASATATSPTIANTTTVTSSFSQITSTSISTSASMNKTSSAEAGNKSKNGSTSPLAKGMAALIVGAVAMLL